MPASARRGCEPILQTGRARLLHEADGVAFPYDAGMFQHTQPVGTRQGKPGAVRDTLLAARHWLLD